MSFMARPASLWRRCAAVCISGTSYSNAGTFHQVSAPADTLFCRISIFPPDAEPDAAGTALLFFNSAADAGFSNPSAFNRIRLRTAFPAARIGAALTENRIALVLPMMYAFTFPMGIDVIDATAYFGAMAHESALRRPEMMARMTKGGRNIAAPLTANDEAGRVRWRGEEAGVCPVRRTRLLPVSHDARTFDCVVCGSRGRLTGDGRAHPRGLYRGRATAYPPALGRQTEAFGQDQNAGAAHRRNSEPQGAEAALRGF